MLRPNLNLSFSSSTSIQCSLFYCSDPVSDSFLSCYTKVRVLTMLDSNQCIAFSLRDGSANAGGVQAAEGRCAWAHGAWHELRRRRRGRAGHRQLPAQHRRADRPVPGAPPASRPRLRRRGRRRRRLRQRLLLRRRQGQQHKRTPASYHHQILYLIAVLLSIEE
jgi:hypothetical protein